MSKILTHALGGGEQDMTLTLREKRAVIRELAANYVSASRKEKGRLISRLIELAVYSRPHAARVLKKPPNLGRPRCSHGKRKLFYGPLVVEDLRKVWLVLDCLSGKRLAPFLSEIVPILERHGELRLDDDTRVKLLSMGAAPIDRKMAEERGCLGVKGRSGTKPGTLLKQSIPIKTFWEWCDTEPGFAEIALIAHDGEDVRGDYVQTRDVVDVAVRWMETRAVKNKAQK